MREQEETLKHLLCSRTCRTTPLHFQMYTPEMGGFQGVSGSEDFSSCLAQQFLKSLITFALFFFFFKKVWKSGLNYG